jgi:hypothetical protein
METTDSSTTEVPSVTCTPSQAPGPDRILASSCLAIAGSAWRTCTATLAGLTSSTAPGCLLVIFRTASTIRAFRARVRRSSVWTNPMSNSEPWLPMRCTSPGSRDIAASSRRARPEMTAVVVAGNMASDRSADAASGSGRTDHRSLVIGASVPS